MTTPELRRRIAARLAAWGSECIANNSIPYLALSIEKRPDGDTAHVHVDCDISPEDIAVWLIQTARLVAPDILTDMIALAAQSLRRVEEGG